jgi:aminopeptidase N
MENLGCVTYREAALLVDEAESSLATKQRVAQVVAHELSHQWFGKASTD